MTEFGETRKGRRRIVSNVNFAWLLPNLLTIAALASGLSAIRYGLADRFEAAVLLVALALSLIHI